MLFQSYWEDGRVKLCKTMEGYGGLYIRFLYVPFMYILIYRKRGYITLAR